MSERASPTLAKSLANGPSICKHVESDEDFWQSIRAGYAYDRTLSKVVENPAGFSAFALRDGILYSKNRQDEEVVCLPWATHKGCSIPELVLDRAHTTLGHLGPQRTSEYVQQWLWWPALRKDVDKFCLSCGTCHTAKVSTKLPLGLLHNLPIPQQPWTSTSMDFVGPFPTSHGFDYIWVIICWLTSMVHLIPVNTTNTAGDLAMMYLQEIVRLHGLLESIVSDQDSKFTSKFWKELHRLIGVKFLMSTTALGQSQ